MLPTLLASIGIFAAIAFVTIIAFYVYYKQKNKRTQDLLALIPGPKAKYPLMGNIDLFRHKGVPLNECVYRTLVALCKLYDKHGMFRIDLGPKALVVLFKHNTMDAIFASNSQIDKSEQYFYIFDWLGDGLLLSTGNKWRKRRKLLTSAFHFRILDDFIPIMNEQSDVLVNKLMKVDKHGYIDIREPITQCTLDIICGKFVLLC
ncbi:unnamed protein product [Medioppia subpectinata]|uniref:Cytochrome P450 n=1 Tax=Medioppia subpectinata TaxID=1979941 RepID=A0A7R9L4N6_9ACAR|nr:unnamed protein product [Medioppia subpectinata]CAG2115281.1 unnamed protein product [Medioppia subpectinata]